MTKLFGTDGIRDIAGEGALSTETVRLVGMAVGSIAVNEPGLFGATPGGRPSVVVVRDTRASGESIRDVLAGGLTSAGCDVHDAGVAPTPLAAFLALDAGHAAALVISASHNPAEYNGIKVFNHRGLKAPDECEARIEELVASPEHLVSAEEKGSVNGMPDGIAAYTGHITGRLGAEFSLAGRSVVLDLAHGATCPVAPEIFRSLGAEVFAINCEPDGANINIESGALHPEAMAAEVKARGADAGFAFDGDGDRVIFADETGTVRDGDFLMAVCAGYMRDCGRLPHDLVVATVMSNVGLERSLESRGMKLLRAPVGDRFVVRKMIETGAMLGGEQSGHIIFMDRTTTGDCICSALGLLEVMVKTGRTLSDLCGCMRQYPQVLVNVRVREKRDLLEIESVRSAHDEITKELADTGRVLLRYSGTEPLVRVMIEGEDQAAINAQADRLAGVIEKELGA